MTEKSYKYDVFISYSSADGPWAKKLFNGLERKSIEVFLDRERLEAGALWNTQLLDGLSDSKHLVVLWSEKAAQSDWVQQEIARFDRIDESSSGQKPSNRRVIFLLLDREANKFFNSFQAITDLWDDGAYAEPADEVGEELWRGVLNKVYDAITSDDEAIPMPLAVLTMTKEQVENLDLAHKPRHAEKPLGEFLKSIGIQTKEELKQYYGPQQTEWQPFDSQPNVLTVLNGLSNEINKELENEGFEKARFRWEPIGEDFWSEDYDAFTREVLKLKRGLLSVVVIDPIALYEEGVRELLRSLNNELRNTRVLFMSLWPWECWKAHHHVREQIRRMAPPVFERLYKPTFEKDSPQASWSCDMSVGDETDTKRALLTALGQHLVDQPKTPFLKN